MSPVDLYRSIAESLVEFPERLQVSHDHRDGCVIVNADESDCGKLIGVKGQNFKACEDLLQAAAINNGWRYRVYLKILKKKSRPGFTKRFEPKANWGKEDNRLLCELIGKLASAVIGGDPQVSSRDISRDSTNVYIRTPGALHERVTGAMSSIVHAIGRNRGRIVFLDFTPS